MTQETFRLLETYMLSCTADSAHDAEHVYRVLYNALEIAAGEAHVDYDVLITACLLHDIGRKEQFADPALCHAAVGSEKARIFLTGQGFTEEFTARVCHCIFTHRFRRAAPPQTVEAKILFDADKLAGCRQRGEAQVRQAFSQFGSKAFLLGADLPVIEIPKMNIHVAIFGMDLTLLETFTPAVCCLPSDVLF